MLNEKRIKEAELNVRSYLNEGLLVKTELIPNVFNILKKNAQESLNVANFLYKKQSPKNRGSLLVCLKLFLNGLKGERLL